VDEVMGTVTNMIVLTEPSAAATTKTIGEVHAGDAEQWTLLVGPEGGWSDQEVQRAAASGAMLLTLGALTLRADAVPIVALTALRVRLEDF
jgi:16S rRNA (uracil1498-N3)-methyltransferase